MFQSDIFEPNINFTLEEANGDVDGKHVLGKIKGCFFVPNGVSRNNRYYSKELWEKVLNSSDVKKRMTEKRMFGTISHSQAIDDTALLEGKISHIITNLSIVNNQGIGEALILDTPAGRVLNTFLRAGSKLFVSSRANGAFKGEENGVPRVDPETYELAGFDVVIDPGFVQANPKLVESLNRLIEEGFKTKDINIINSEEDLQMNELLESVSRENASLKNDIDKVMKELTSFKNENTILGEENNHMKAKFSTLENKVVEQETLLKEYSVIGNPKDIDTVIKDTDSKLKQYEAICKDPAELSETLNLLESYSKIGTPTKIDEAFDKAITAVKAYSHLGSPAEIDEAFDSGIREVMAYKEFGSISELKELFEKLENNAVTIKEERNSKKITELATTLKVTEEAIKELWGKLSEVQIKSFFEKMNPTPVAEVTPVATPVVVAPVVEEQLSPLAAKFLKKEVTPVKEVIAVAEEAGMFSKTRGQRMMESFSK